MTLDWNQILLSAGSPVPFDRTAAILESFLRQLPLVKPHELAPRRLLVDQHSQAYHPTRISAIGIKRGHGRAELAWSQVQRGTWDRVDLINLETWVKLPPLRVMRGN